MALLIRADGTRKEIQGTGERDTVVWNQIKDAIGGGFVQMFECDPDVAEGHHVVCCDEEGKLKAFPPNPEATKLSTYTAPGDMLVGDMLVGDILFLRKGDGEDLF